MRALDVKINIISRRAHTGEGNENNGSVGRATADKSQKSLETILSDESE